MQFTLRDLLVSSACATVALGLTKWVVESPPSNPGTGAIIMFTLLMSASSALFGASCGALLKCPWRGLFIGLASTSATLISFFALGGR